jgi:hypothetical protein
LKISVNQAHTVVGGDLNSFDVIDRSRHGALGHEEDASRHVVRTHAVVTPDHADHRNVDVGENIVGVVTIERPPMMAIKIAITINV